MAGIEYYRVDLQFVVRRQDDGSVLTLAGTPARWHKGFVSAPEVQKWLEHPDSVPHLPSTLPLGRALKEWQAREKVRVPPPRGGAPVSWLKRLTVEVDDPALAALAWEQCLASVIPDAPRVRVSRVQPRAANLPFTLPMRILQVNPVPDRDLAAMTRQVFGLHPDSGIRRVMVVRSVSWDPGALWPAPVGWPTVEVLHFDRLPTLELPEERLLMSTADPDHPGRLGWFTRWTGIWQTRLVWIHCHSPQEIARARKLAGALTARGGPAVVVEGLRPPGASAFCRYFYGQLIHDFPLDHILQNDLQPTCHRAGFARPSLFAGSGREEGLRFSHIGQNLVRLANVLSRPRKAPRQSEEISRLIRRQPGVRVEKARAAVRSVLEELRTDWPTSKFDLHEGEGLLPLSDKLSRIRSVMKLAAPAPGTYAHGAREVQLQTRKRTPAARYVNSSLWEEAGYGSLKQIDQRRALLRVSEVNHLGIQIGPKDIHVYTSGASAIFEEVFKWTPAMEGVWVEIGVTGLDFEVLGDPVQELWLPREGASDTAYFAVVPRTTGVARLRFCLFYRQNVIQSFRLAVVTAGPRKNAPPSTVRRRLLAKALGLPLQEMKNVGYIPRLEYSLTTDIGDLGARPERALSLVANDLDGESVITVKGADIFGVRTNRDLPGLVEDVRKALHEVTYPPIPGVIRDNWPYGFGLPGRPNAGDEPRLKAGLQKLASVGWQLFDKIFPQQSREEMERALQKQRQVIHVAEVLLEKVIPWAVVYDRFYDPDKQVDDEGNPVTFDACLAALPGPDGKLPARDCAQLPDCPLHPDHAKERRRKGLPVLLPETVVCPLHFWGFKHILEVPPQQMLGTAGGPRPLQDCVLTEGTVQMAAAINGKLDLAKEHIDELEALPGKFPAKWCSKEYRRDPVLLKLKNPNLDFIYFYCHARGGIADPGIRPPYLAVQAKEDPKPGLIKPDQLSYHRRWDHHPLVFLNGCGTVGYSPDALSPFIEKLVQDRGAAGVIGTEIPVHEALASKFAKLFLQAFFEGKPAGEAMLLARRALLAESNPLGLVYTLYAAAELSLAGITCIKQ
jgi:hypothetical protein